MAPLRLSVQTSSPNIITTAIIVTLLLLTIIIRLSSDAHFRSASTSSQTRIPYMDMADTPANDYYPDTSRNYGCNSTPICMYLTFLVVMGLIIVAGISLWHWQRRTPALSIAAIAAMFTLTNRTTIHHVTTHTGPANVVLFFEETLPQQGLEAEEIFEMYADGRRRPWAADRDGGLENVSERKKWLVLARIRRATS
ncbi:hypothetical protein J1614_005694 [Plenodomus biglobosus]|nr:hypothetical protein J1614_005694 [Plenodomus biglobosus]